MLTTKLICTLILFPSVILLLIKAWKKFSTTKKHEKLPPSPWKLPFIGHIHHLVGDAPHRALARVAQKYGPIVYLELGQAPLVVISSRETAREVLKVQDLACADRPQSIGTKIIWYNYADMAFCPYGERWKQMRKILITELLSSKNVKSFGSIRHDEVLRVINSVQSSSGGAPINLTKKIFALVNSITCRAAFGQVSMDRELVISMTNEAMALSAGFGLADFFPSVKLFHLLSWTKYKLLRMHRELDAILEVLLEEHIR